VVFSGFSSKDKVYYTTSTTETKQNSPHYSFFSSRILFSLFYIQVFGRSKESDNKVKKVIAFPVKILSRRRRRLIKKTKNSHHRSSKEKKSHQITCFLISFLSFLSNIMIQKLSPFGVFAL
tara:strand:- start:266 stop:628 length:363 start_codon:yes stop_codon:yes gene_type:complete